jgi:hypothetical protein
LHLSKEQRQRLLRRLEEQNTTGNFGGDLKERDRMDIMHFMKK